MPHLRASAEVHQRDEPARLPTVAGLARGSLGPGRSCVKDSRVAGGRRWACRPCGPRDLRVVAGERVRRDAEVANRESSASTVSSGAARGARGPAGRVRGRPRRRSDASMTRHCRRRRIAAVWGRARCRRRGRSRTRRPRRAPAAPRPRRCYPRRRLPELAGVRHLCTVPAASARPANNRRRQAHPAQRPPHQGDGPLPDPGPPPSRSPERDHFLSTVASVRDLVLHYA